MSRHRTRTDPAFWLAVVFGLLAVFWSCAMHGATTIYDHPTPDGKRTVQVCDLPEEEPQ